MPADRDLVLLYDGRCGFCNGTVRFILARDAGGAMKFAPLQGTFARDVLARHPELAGVDSIVVVEREAGSGERVFTRSEAALAIARYLGGRWRFMEILRLVPRIVRDWAYDRFARVRYRLFGRHDSSRSPKPKDHERFLA